MPTPIRAEALVTPSLVGETLTPPGAGPVTAMPDTAGSDFAQSFAKGLLVIRSFSESRPRQTLTQVAQATGLSRAGARRLLLTLVQLGYATCEGRAFSLTPRILDLGFSYLSSMPFWKLAQPVMEELARTLGESCSISVLDGWQIVYVLRVHTRRIMSITLSVGSRLPAYCSSMGRVLLAGLPPEELNTVLAASDIRAYTSATVTDLHALRQAVTDCRNQGWAFVSRELEEELASLSVPIANRNGKTIAAINMSARPLTLADDEKRAAALNTLRQAARDITAMLV